MVGIVIALATIMIAQKTEMTPRRRNAIAAWLGLWILAAVVEFFNGQLLRLVVIIIPNLTDTIIHLFL